MNKTIIGFCLVIGAASQALAYEPPAVQVDTLAKATASWDGNRLPAYLREAPEISVLRIRVPAGTTLPMHKHPVINAGYLVRGELTVITDDDRTLHLKAGDALVEVVNTWHYGKNESNELAEIVVFYAGAPGVPLSVKK